LSQLSPSQGKNNPEWEAETQRCLISRGQRPAQNGWRVPNALAHTPPAPVSWTRNAAARPAALPDYLENCLSERIALPIPSEFQLIPYSNIITIMPHKIH